MPDPFGYVAEEIVIEETVVNNENEYEENVSMSPKYFEKNSNLDEECENTIDSNTESDFLNIDHNEIEVVQDEISNDGNVKQIEPIYLSDSMSCFGSDSETEDSEMPHTMDSTKSQTDDSISAQQTEDDDDDIERLNESADDVIIIPESAISVENNQSGPDDVECLPSYSNRTVVESDSQQSVKLVKCRESRNIAKQTFRYDFELNLNTFTYFRCTTLFDIYYEKNCI